MILKHKMFRSFYGKKRRTVSAPQALPQAMIVTDISPNNFKPVAKPSETSNDLSDGSRDKKHERLLALGSYDFITETAQIKLHNFDLEHKTISWSLWYRNEELSKDTVRDVTDEESSFGGLKKIFEIPMEKIARHVFYKTFELHYSYCFLKDKTEIHESIFELWVTFLRCLFISTLFKTIFKDSSSRKRHRINFHESASVPPVN